MSKAYDRAVDAINELSHRLADVDREQFLAEQEGKRLRAENAKLRELVDELYPLADYGAMDASELDRAHDLMRELGIEVG